MFQQKQSVAPKKTSAGFRYPMELEVEKKFKCPYCFEKISMILDLSEEGSQLYIEDCEVCCKPIQINFEVRDTKLTGFDSQAAF